MGLFQRRIGPITITFHLCRRYYELKTYSWAPKVRFPPAFDRHGGTLFQRRFKALIVRPAFAQSTVLGSHFAAVPGR